MWFELRVKQHEFEEVLGLMPCIYFHGLSDASLFMRTNRIYTCYTLILQSYPSSLST